MFKVFSLREKTLRGEKFKGKDVADTLFVELEPLEMYIFKDALSMILMHKCAKTAVLGH